MNDFLQPLLSWVQLNPLTFGLFIFAISMLESLAIIGLLVPGVAILFAIGNLIHLGAISFTHACIWAACGAITGDALSYWLGRRYADKIPTYWPFKQHPERLQKGIYFFHRNGQKSIVIGRFIGPLRAVVPLVAGMLSMPPSAFFSANIASAILWAPIYLLPGMLFSSSIQSSSNLTLGISGLIIFTLISLWLFTRYLPMLGKKIAQGSDWILIQVTSPSQYKPNTATQTSAAFIVVGFCTTLLIALDTKFWHQLHSLDQQLLAILLNQHTVTLDYWFTYITRLSDNIPTFAFIIGATFYFVIQQDKQRLTYWMLLAVASILLAPLLKFSWQISRPDVLLNPDTSYSFPSGHALRATLLWAGLALLLSLDSTRQKRRIWLLFGSIMILAIGLSRLYLGVHWLSDILASICLGLAILGLIGRSLYQQTGVPSPAPFRLFGLFMGLICVWGIQSSFYHQRDLNHYQVRTLNISLNDWLSDNNRLPKAIINPLGWNHNALNLQFSGDIQKLSEYLQAQGWHLIDYSSQDAILQLFHRDESQKPPLMPHTHAAKQAELIFQKQLIQASRHVIRLWPSPVTLGLENTPIWLGEVSQQVTTEWLGIFPYSSSQQQLSRSLLDLWKDLSQTPLLLNIQTTYLQVHSSK